MEVNVTSPTQLDQSIVQNPNHSYASWTLTGWKNLPAKVYVIYHTLGLVYNSTSNPPVLPSIRSYPMQCTIYRRRISSLLQCLGAMWFLILDSSKHWRTAWSSAYMNIAILQMWLSSTINIWRGVQITKPGHAFRSYNQHIPPRFSSFGIYAETTTDHNSLTCGTSAASKSFCLVAQYVSQ